MDKKNIIKNRGKKGIRRPLRQLTGMLVLDKKQYLYINKNTPKFLPILSNFFKHWKGKQKKKLQQNW